MIFLKVRSRKCGSISVAEAEWNVFVLDISVFISKINLKTHRKNRRNLKNTKNKVPKSGIDCISMISTDSDGGWTRFRAISKDFR